MKLTVNNKLLIRAAERCSAATDPRGTHPHTSKVLLSGVIHEDGESCLQAFATNLILQVDTAAKARVEEKGGVAVDCRRLMAMVSAMPQGDISLMTNSGRLVLSCAGARSYAMPVISVEQFPTPVEPSEQAQRCTIPSDLLSRALPRVQHCIDASTTREHLRGTYLDIADGVFNAVTLGSYMVATVNAQLDQPPWAGLLPLSALRLIGSLGTENDDLTLLLDDGKVFVESKDTMVGGLLPRVDFPVWRNVLAGMNRVRVARVPCILLQDALKAVLAGRSSDQSELNLDAQDGKLRISLVGDECQAEDEIAIESLDRAEASWALDPLYLLDTVKGANTDFVLEDCAEGAVVSTDDGYLGMVARKRPRPEPAGSQGQRQPGNGDGKGKASDAS